MLNNYSINKINWSLRKLKLPIGKNNLVLEIGSGSNPHPWSDVLIEKYLDNKHRYENMVFDRPLVLGDGCKMPFRDNAFDYIIAFHVLEHIKTPELFLNELQRVGRAGYIETPNAIFERLNPYPVHVLEIAHINEKLIINKKTGPAPDGFFNKLELVKNSEKWNKLFYDNPSLFHENNQQYIFCHKYYF